MAERNSTHQENWIKTKQEAEQKLYKLRRSERETPHGFCEIEEKEIKPNQASYLKRARKEKKCFCFIVNGQKPKRV